MKKHWLLLLLLPLWLVACSDTNKDEFAAYRHMTSQEIFNQGEKSLAKKNYSDAVKYFEALDAIYPFGPYARQGQLDVIYAYYMDNDEASALASADRYIRLYPRDRGVDYALYMKGLITFTEGLSWLQRWAGSDPAPRDITNLQHAFNAFAIIVSDFPSSIYYQDSLIRMAYIRNLLARRDVLIAQFYYEKRSYVASANRANEVVQHFQGSPYVIPALALMVKSYQALHLPDMANNSLKVLRANYPNAPELKDLKESK